ncbi:MAG: AAA family ATPase [Gammaproteobacteria bacterium]|nr:AAA family ATPase [Gammaproteobacteria bacterium]
MYEAFYNLHAKPFQLNPDPRFFYGSRGHMRVMSYLEYGLHQGEGFIVITGEIGAGKTTLVRNLFRKLDTEHVVAANLVSTQLDADDTLRMVVAAFGLPHEDASKAILLKKLEAFLLSLHNQGKRALLVVDEAQNLTPRAVEELRMLSNFQCGEKSLLQSFLLGQPEFRNTLQGEDMQQLRQRVIASYHLGPMDEPETRAYIEHRLQTAGWKGDPSFSADAFSAIYNYTGGIPRKINTLCDRLMLLGYLEDMHALDQAAVKEVIVDLVGEVGGTGEPRSYDSDIEASVLREEKELEIQSNLARLEDRISQMEKSVIKVLKLLREILALPSVERLRKEGQ